jgi:hypothetical protein
MAPLMAVWQSGSMPDANDQSRIRDRFHSASMRRPSSCNSRLPCERGTRKGEGEYEGDNEYECAGEGEGEQEGDREESAREGIKTRIQATRVQHMAIQCDQPTP